MHFNQLRVRGIAVLFEKIHEATEMKLLLLWIAII